MNLDRDLVQEASVALGTSGATETVHAAMRDAVRRRALESLVKHDFSDLTLEALEELRRPRTFDHLRGD